MRPQEWGWGKLCSQAFLGPPPALDGRSGTCKLAGLRHGWVEEPVPGGHPPILAPDSFTGTGVCPDPAGICTFALAALVLVLRGAGPVPGCSGEHGQLLLGVPGAGLGRGVPWAVSALGLGALMLPTKAWQRRGGWPGTGALSLGISGRDLSLVASLRSRPSPRSGRGEDWVSHGHGGSCLCAGSGSAPAMLDKGKASLLQLLRGWEQPGTPPLQGGCCSEKPLRHRAGRAPAGAPKDSDGPRMGTCVLRPRPPAREQLPGHGWGLVPLPGPGFSMVRVPRWIIARG